MCDAALDGGIGARVNSGGTGLVGVVSATAANLTGRVVDNAGTRLTRVVSDAVDATTRTGLSTTLGALHAFSFIHLNLVGKCGSSFRAETRGANRPSGPLAISHERGIAGKVVQLGARIDLRVDGLSIGAEDVRVALEVHGREDMDDDGAGNGTHPHNEVVLAPRPGKQGGDKHAPRIGEGASIRAQRGDEEVHHTHEEIVTAVHGEGLGMHASGGRCLATKSIQEHLVHRAGEEPGQHNLRAERGPVHVTRIHDELGPELRVGVLKHGRGHEETHAPSDELREHVASQLHCVHAVREDEEEGYRGVEVSARIGAEGVRGDHGGKRARQDQDQGDDKTPGNGVLQTCHHRSELHDGDEDGRADLAVALAIRLAPHHGLLAETTLHLLRGLTGAVVHELTVVGIIVVVLSRERHGMWGEEKG